MGKIEILEKEIESLSSEELKVFRNWFIEYDAQLWDEQVKVDIKSGKLDAFAEEAIKSHKKGKSRELWFILLHQNSGKILIICQNQFKLRLKRTSSYKENPKHPSLHFKKINNYFSVRANIQYRALGVEVENGVLWFWIGSHSDYDKLLS